MWFAQGEEIACSFSAVVRLTPSWTRWNTSRSAAGERLWYSTVGFVASGARRVCVCVWSGVGRAGFRVIYVLWAEERRTACDEFLGEILLFGCGDLGARCTRGS